MNTVAPQFVIRGIKITGTVSEVDACSRVLELVARGHGADVHLCNAYTLVTAASSEDLRERLQAASLNLCDGVPLALVGRHFAGAPFRASRGPDLFRNLLSGEQSPSLRHYLYGGAPETLANLEARIGELYPRCQIVGAESPPFEAFEDMDLDAVARKIAAADAQVVWVGLGTPKQDFVVSELARRVPAVCIAIGAAFDFVAGTTKEAPHVLRASGLEWTYRLGSEPRRLWRRYLLGNLQFLGLILQEARDARRRRP